MASFHVGVSAEAFAAGFFAQVGCDVLVQYGANQPNYDLVATRGRRIIKISVKGSQDGAWGLIQNYKAKGISYHRAADRWAADQSPVIVYCLVQFKNVKLGGSPRVYLATVKEIATWHKASRKGFGGTTLYEDHRYVRGRAAKTTDRIPVEWRFSEKRLGEMLRVCGGEAVGKARLQIPVRGKRQVPSLSLRRLRLSSHLRQGRLRRTRYVAV